VSTIALMDQPANTQSPPLFDFLPSELWLINHFQVEPQNGLVRVDLSGWAFPDPKLGAASPGNFLLNDTPFDEIRYPIVRDDVGDKFWQRKYSRYSGYKCSAVLPRSRVYVDGVLALTYASPGVPPAVPAQQSWFRFDPALELPFPDEARRFRVIADTDVGNFALGGFTDFKRLDAAVAAFSGKGFSGFPRILDFGCGCGRVARYTSQVPGVALSGCDIDTDNAGWCADHLSGAFLGSKIDPPTPFPDNSFDLIYGVSVFTHLREPFQDAWLAELERLAAPGAWVLMTIHGRTALDYAGVPPPDYEELERRISAQGLYVSGTNTQIDGYAQHKGEYVNVFHDLTYVRNRWSEYFEIITILPGYIYTHDLVIMRKTASAGRKRRWPSFRKYLSPAYWKS
jgi:SAM-dependent methyltransferase